MNPEPATSPKHRRAWLALLIGSLALTGLFFASIVAEPFLIALAIEAVNAEPRSSASGWANSSVWLVSIGVCCLALLAIGYVAKSLSPPRSWIAPIALFVLVILYVFFAQFPATRSHLRIELWSIALPASLAIGVWLASRAQSAV